MTRYSRALAWLGSASALLALAGGAVAHDIKAKPGNAKSPSFDIVQTQIIRSGSDLIFTMAVSAKAGASRPAKTGQLAGSSIYSYVWPTSIDSSAVGFDAEQGILALL